jgi:DNA-binding protein YbaB
VSNGAARHELEDVLARVQEQMTDLAEVQKKQAAMTAKAAAADGTVEVTVNARGAVIKTVVDEAYLEEYNFADLGGYITDAAQTAARNVAQRVAELMVPLNERRKQLPSLSDIVDGAPDLRSLFDDLNNASARPAATPDTRGDDWEEPTDYPTVRS